jgi:hypothetical protein
MEDKFQKFITFFNKNGKDSISSNVFEYVAPLPDKLNGLPEGYGKEELQEELTKITRIRLKQKSNPSVKLNDADQEDLNYFKNYILPYLPEPNSKSFGGRKRKRHSVKKSKKSKKSRKSRKSRK